MIEAFRSSPLLLLFVVCAIGYWVGSIRIRGTSLGVAAVLFVGLGFGALDKGLMVPEIIIFLGLSIFVYTIGLSSGPVFFATFKRRGFRDILFVVGMLTFSAAITVGLFHLFDLEAATAAGLFAGSTTNTPALAGLLDLIQKTASSQELSTMAQEAVVGYSLSYPMGVLGVMLVIGVMQKWLHIDYKAEEVILQKNYPINEIISSQTIEVTNEAVIGIELRELFRRFNGRIVFGRLQRGEEIRLANWDTQLQLHDNLVIIAGANLLEEVTKLLGRFSSNQLDYDRRLYDIRGLFVSNPKIAGEKIAALNLQEKYPAVITRVQRGDVTLLANGETILELGDRVQIVARRKDLPALNSFFGNSYEALSHINLFSFGVGMALGLLLGMVNFQLPGGINFNLGFAGGPLVVALFLGNLRRTGAIVWALPYSANLSLRQFSLILLLAGIGIRSGHTFLTTLMEGGGALIFLCGAIISCLSAFATLLIGFKLLKIPFSFLTGMVANQPAILDYAMQSSGNKLPTIGYTVMLPIAVITKILFVQILFALLN
ncbi:MAG: TrkA C-terminal domain-containing protein [Saprospiraceae bacterium]